MTELPEAPLAGKYLDARQHLLGRQVLDADQVPVGVADDIEFDGTADPPHVVALLTGNALTARIFGTALPKSRFDRLRWDDVAHLGVTIELNVRADALDTMWVDRWIRDSIIGRIPGARSKP